jgi:hypothetical protein
VAVLEPIMASAEESYIGSLRSRWPDESLGEHCLVFVESFYAFWNRNARILHLRNNLADARDPRMVEHRISYSLPLISLFAEQMDWPATSDSPAHSAATVLLTGIERLITITTDADFPSLIKGSIAQDPASHVRSLLVASARLLELGIRDHRAAAAKAQIAARSLSAGSAQPPLPLPGTP